MEEQKQLDKLDQATEKALKQVEKENKKISILSFFFHKFS